MAREGSLEHVLAKDVQRAHRDPPQEAMAWLSRNDVVLRVRRPQPSSLILGQPCSVHEEQGLPKPRVEARA